MPGLYTPPILGLEDTTQKGNKLKAGKLAPVVPCATLYTNGQKAGKQAHVRSFWEG